MSENSQPAREKVQLLIKLLKLGSLISVPMCDGLSKPMGLSIAELKILMALSEEGALAGVELSLLLGIPPMTVSRSIATLRRLGWIADVGHSSNKRLKPICLTSAGIAARESAIPYLEAIAGELFRDISGRRMSEFSISIDAVNDQIARWMSDEAASS